MNIFFTNNIKILKMLIHFQEMSTADFVLKNVKVLNLYHFVHLKTITKNFHWTSADIKMKNFAITVNSF